ncbi:hypothetical protein [Variovorax sp. DT-64]|uniref:hypothetical protein n=1 Tax=Variovorax sp. DT-64 TaxID=3396160 RepID=UPI003F1B7DE9
MPAIRLHRHTLGHGSRSPGVWLALLLGTSVAVAGSTHAQEPPRRVVAQEQLARDNDRILILRQELARSEARLQTLARRKTERSAGVTDEGVDDVEEQRRRTLEDVAGLRRELALALRAADPARRPRPAAPRVPAPAPAWWDVYGRAPTPVKSAPLRAGLASEKEQPVSGQVE